MLDYEIAIYGGMGPSSESHGDGGRVSVNVRLQQKSTVTQRIRVTELIDSIRSTLHVDNGPVR